MRLPVGRLTQKSRKVCNVRCRHAPAGRAVRQPRVPEPQGAIHVVGNLSGVSELRGATYV